jgi:uncharacterized protein YgbK (DUF1537 family)
VRAGGSVLIAAGSRNGVTRRQIEFLKVRVPYLGHREVTLPHGMLPLAPHEDALLLTLSEAGSNTPPPVAAERLADAAAKILERSGSRQLILTGGDIAAAVCRRLRVEALEIVGAVEDGIPLVRLRGGMADGTLAVTKAGGFGTEESLYCAYKLLLGDE